MLKKHLKNIKYISEVQKYAKRKIRNLLFLIAGLIILSFAFLFFTGNLYVFLVDVSPSMLSSLSSRQGNYISKIEALKNSINKFIDKKYEGSFMLVTYSDHGNYPNAPFTVLDSILNYASPDEFGGVIVIPPTAEKEVAKKMISTISIGSSTHLSEALYKTLYKLKSVYNPFSNIVVMIFGDGDDQNYCIQEDKNVIVNENWNFIGKLKVHTIKIAADAVGSNNFRILANAGKGESVDVQYVEEFYERLLHFSKNETIIITHIVISLLLIISAVIVFLKK